MELMNEAGVYDPDWADLEWSPWLQLDADGDELSTLSTDAGLYRVRHDAYEGLIYIGETGRSLRGRIRSLIRNVFETEMPYSDPHTASPSLWAIVDQHGPGFEISGATPPAATDKQQRKAIEDALIALHRRETRTNLIGNFGRMPPGYSKSKQRSAGIRGNRTDANQRSFQDGIDPLTWENPDGLTDADWMGLSWSTPTRLSELDSTVPAEVASIDSGIPMLCHHSNTLVNQSRLAIACVVTNAIVTRTSLYPTRLRKPSLRNFS
ncbi:GIY-YIG nuclease family protein [Haloarcula nitratireducens]|uniref:GIY-YIG nuclease family protein n=1 Tax=Haloarcula nitratireducens TaxID=2487749 RepID=A0AAW4PGP1_9EURY|nr:GIY-YIG nuclease family protein [Halomicroarcula nitratireducens]MBX0297068.1 GIY-YIG nuclease family protein [Halomicroarcula nitratireducens]